MKLHIGCGKKFLPGFKHLDVIPFEHVDYECDTRELIMIRDEEVSEIYACHILEHVKRHEVKDVLKEWARVLKPGGLLRISVPNFSAIVAEYNANGDLSRLQGLLYGGQTYDYNYHHVAFDLNFITSLLSDVGFISVSEYDWRDFLPPGFDDYSRSYLPHMEFETGRQMSLNVVAAKK